MNNRRSFIKSVSVLTAGAMLSGKQLTAQPIVAPRPVVTNRRINVFSKHFQWLSYAEMAKVVKEIGFDGIDLTVRPAGHVLPERVKEDLPRAVKEIRNQGLVIDRITTAIVDPDSPLTLPILETAASLGIRNYRLGWLDYDKKLTVKEHLAQLNKRMVKLAAINKRLGLTGAYQNHVGEQVGGAVWDIAILLEGIDPRDLGVRYDIRHATVSGGTSWPVALNYISEKVNSLDIKDFIWQKLNGKWQPVTVPLGEGMVDFARYLKTIKAENIPGDMTMHFEYELGGADQGQSTITVAPEVVISAMKRDLGLLRSWL